MATAISAEFVARTFEDTNHDNVNQFIWSHIRRHPTFAIMMVVGAFMNAALAAIVPVFTGLAFEAILNDRDLDRVFQLCVAIVVSQLVRGVFQFMRNVSSEVFSQRIERDVRDELYVSLLGKSMTFHDFQPVGEIMARVTNDVREVNLMMNPGFNLIIGSSMFILLPIIVAPTIHPTLILMPLLYVVGFVIAQAWYVRSLYGTAKSVRESFGQMNAQLAEKLDGIEVIKGTARENDEKVSLNKLIDAVRDWFIQQGDLEARYYALLVWGMVTVLGFLQSALLYRADEIAAGDIVAFMGQLALFGFPTFTSTFTFSRVASGRAAADRILAIINTITDLDQNISGHRGELVGNVEFQNVAFGYVDEKTVLHDVSLKINAGQTIAIVGQTGSGKTTLTKLMNRTYDIDSGHVLVDNHDVRDWNLASLRSQISIIEQEIFLFSRSVADNIRFGKPYATQAEVEEAAKNAQAHDFIMQFPQGYDTVIGQRGVTLSGGQRQRLAIARAFLTDPRILILDDSTSAIDSATEDRIQQAIWRIAEGRTTILITHRLSQIRWADHILVLKNGRVVAQGDHDTLLAGSEPYQRIFAQYED